MAYGQRVDSMLKPVKRWRGLLKPALAPAGEPHPAELPTAAGTPDQACFLVEQVHPGWPPRHAGSVANSRCSVPARSESYLQVKRRRRPGSLAQVHAVAL